MDLRIAWVLRIPIRQTGWNSTTEAVPIVVNGVLYSPTVQHAIVALEPETGEELWRFDLGRASGTLRGVTYWAGDANNPPRILQVRRTVR